LTNPTVGIVGCCARAVRGQPTAVAAAPPSSVMNSRRFIRSPRRRGRVIAKTANQKGGADGFLSIFRPF
jgi:hypothetical protein